jgi:spermidine synthase
VALAITSAVLALPDGTTLWATLHGAQPRAVITAEDGTGVSLLKGRSRDFSRGVVVLVNGLGQSWLPYGGIHSELGALPAMMHPAPRDAAVIGLGSGDTLFALAGRRELERITSIEIIKPQIETVRQLVPLFPDPALASWLGDPRVEHVFDDGRAYLRDQGRRFDILEADALRPTSAYAGNLYSDAYFRLLRDRLKPNGLAVTWMPTDRVRRTFMSVFPHAIRFGDVLVGSNEPIAIDREAIARRLADPDVQAYYGQGGINVRELLEPRLAGAVRYTMMPADDINTDLYPRDEVAR